MSSFSQKAYSQMEETYINKCMWIFKNQHMQNQAQVNTHKFVQRHLTGRLISYEMASKLGLPGTETQLHDSSVHNINLVIFCQSIYLLWVKVVVLLFDNMIKI